MMLTNNLSNVCFSVGFSSFFFSFSKQDLYKGASFDTIAGFGPNGAIIHYR